MSEVNQINTTEIVLDFIVHLCKEMLASGANLERVNISVRRICRCYHLNEISVFYAASAISVGITDEKGRNYNRQERVPTPGIQLNKLGRLNLLVHDIINKKPRPEELKDMLNAALEIKSYPDGIQILGYIIAMICLCKIFGGKFPEMLIVIASTVILFYMTKFFSNVKLNRIISNAIEMMLCGCIAILFTRIGFTQNMSAIIITNAFFLIPGIPMVNAMRNIFCGNEMNGIIEMVKVLLEVVSIVAGLYIASLIFGANVVTLF